MCACIGRMQRIYYILCVRASHLRSQAYTHTFTSRTALLHLKCRFGIDYNFTRRARVAPKCRYIYNAPKKSIINCRRPVRERHKSLCPCKRPATRMCRCRWHTAEPTMRCPPDTQNARTLDTSHCAFARKRHTPDCLQCSVFI